MATEQEITQYIAKNNRSPVLFEKIETVSVFNSTPQEFQHPPESADEVYHWVKIVNNKIYQYYWMYGESQPRVCVFIQTNNEDKILDDYLPRIAITETFVVNSQAEMLALDAQTGDIAIRTDANTVYILKDSNPSVLSHWYPLTVVMQPDWSQAVTSSPDFIKNKPFISLNTLTFDVVSGTLNLKDVVTQQGNTFNVAGKLLQLNASGLINDALISTTITKQGNTFNGANQLIKFDANIYYPAGDGRNITGLKTSQITNDSGYATITYVDAQLLLKSNLTYVNEQLLLKVDKVAGKQLSTNDYTTTEKNKLTGIENNANNYTHPATHSLSMITETTDLKVFTASERLKLTGIDNNANNYTHPATHSLSMITETTDLKVFTSDERTKLSGIDNNANNYTHPATHSLSMITETTDLKVFTSDERIKLAAVKLVQTQANWTETVTTAEAYIKNKPDLTVYAIKTEVNTQLASIQAALNQISSDLDEIIG